jgi:hypothetical protein
MQPGWRTSSHKGGGGESECHGSADSECEDVCAVACCLAPTEDPGAQSLGQAGRWLNYRGCCHCTIRRCRRYCRCGCSRPSLRCSRSLPVPSQMPLGLAGKSAVPGNCLHTVAEWSPSPPTPPPPPPPAAAAAAAAAPVFAAGLDFAHIRGACGTGSPRPSRWAYRMVYAMPLPGNPRSPLGDERPSRSRRHSCHRCPHCQGSYCGCHHCCSSYPCRWCPPPLMAWRVPLGHGRAVTHERPLLLFRLSGAPATDPAPFAVRCSPFAVRLRQARGGTIGVCSGTLRTRGPPRLEP